MRDVKGSHFHMLISAQASEVQLSFACPCNRSCSGKLVVYLKGKKEGLTTLVFIVQDIAP